MPARVSTLVGRDDELHAITQTMAAVRPGPGRALFLAGERGIGKSRLVAAARERAAAEGMRLLHGRASAIGPAIALRAVREALLRLPHEPDPPDVTHLGPYRATLAALVPDWAPDGTAAPPDPGDLLVLAEGVLRLAGLVGRGRGVLIVLEDLHHADGATLAVLDYLVDHLDRYPVLLLGTLRDDAGAARDLVRAAAGRGACEVREPGRLAPADLRLLAGTRLATDPDELPEPVIDLLWAGSGGNPARAEEVLAELVGAGALLATPTGWRVAREVGAAGPDLQPVTGTGTGRPPAVPPVLLRSLTRPVELLAPAPRDLILLAAVLGTRFPLTVLRQATGRHDREIQADLHREPLARLVRPEQPASDWYAFVHPLLRAALLALLGPADRTRLARRAAEAATAVHPGLPGPWCQTVAALRLDAGDRTTAGHLLAEAGHRALTEGAADRAVTLLDRAADLLATADVEARADLLERQIAASTEAGAVDRALGHAGAVDELAGRLDRPRRARLHTALAWAASAAGRPADGLRHVDTARVLLGPDAADVLTAPVDVAAAHLRCRSAGPAGTATVEATLRQAEAVARAAPLPAVACRAGFLLGVLTRPRDPDAATDHLTRAWSVAVRHHEPLEELHALVRLGEDDVLRGGDAHRLDQAHRTAARVGAVAVGHRAQAGLALHAVLRADFAAAEILVDDLAAAGARLRLTEVTRRAALLRAVLAAHQGRQRRMTDALADLCRPGGDPGRYASATHGLARVFCALLKENRPRALHESWRAARADEEDPTRCPLAGRHGLHLLLRAVGGDLDPATLAELATAPVGRLRWNDQFRLLARAVLRGRAGRRTEAAAAVAEALRVGAPYPTARNLGLRLVSEAALADGWGQPVEWLRTAEEHFHDAHVPAVAAACRTLLRRAGSRPFQRRAGIEEVPVAFRSAGVTPREYEVLGLLAGRLSNREIADRLHLSARTVEKHVASLIAKTGQPDRIALGRLAVTTAPPGPPDLR